MCTFLLPFAPIFCQMKMTAPTYSFEYSCLCGGASACCPLTLFEKTLVAELVEQAVHLVLRSQSAQPDTLKGFTITFHLP